jgi:uncharacterized integral membrane protein
VKLLFRIVAIILFILFFGFAIKNTHEAILYTFLGHDVKAPLVLLLLAFFIGGAALGIASMLPTLFRHRRELARHKKAIADIEKERAAQQQARMQPPQPDSVINK